MRETLVKQTSIKLRHLIHGLTLIIFLVSCQRSQFATTTRHSERGRVTYSKTWHHETRIVSGIKPVRHHLKQEIKSETGKREPEQTGLVNKFIPVHKMKDDVVLASATLDPAFLKIAATNTTQPDNPLVSASNSTRSVRSSAVPDTIIKNSEKNTGDTILSVPVKRKTEKHALTGFIFSIVGLFPLIGLPFAIMGLIFSIAGYRKIKKNPSLYKGKGLAIAGETMGIIGILGSVLAILFFTAMVLLAATPA